MEILAERLLVAEEADERRREIARARQRPWRRAVSADIGEVWGDTGVTAKNPSAAYYALYLAGDWKISPQWTWNVFNARYRDAFSFKWVTPKISTGLTYNINSNNAVYGTVGYSWKDTGAGLKGSNINVGLGYKYSW